MEDLPLFGTALGVGQRIGLLEASKNWSPLQAHPHPPFMQACVVNGLGYSEEETAPPNLSSQFILSVTSYFYVEQSIENMGPHGKLGSRTLTIQMLFTCLQMNGGCRAPAGRNPSSLVPGISLQ